MTLQAFGPDDFSGGGRGGQLCRGRLPARVSRSRAGARRGAADQPLDAGRHPLRRRAGPTSTCTSCAPWAAHQRFAAACTRSRSCWRNISESLAAKVRFQKFRIRHPDHRRSGGDGQPDRRVAPESTRADPALHALRHAPFPDQDPHDPRGTFLGANDGASGTALLMELAHDMRDDQG